jgi:predicted acyltransferase
MPTEVMHTTSASSKLVAKPRLISVDVFRGISVAVMILVDDPGDRFHIYWPLAHAQWNGWTPTDLIFPFFLFIVGMSIVLSFSSRCARGATKSEFLAHSLKRSAIIFALGLFLSAYPVFDLHSTRICGVLQRIALVYLATSVIVLYTSRKTRYITCWAILLGYWGLMALVPVPGHGAGVLTMDGSLAGYIDRKLLYNHLAIPHRFDPEGLLSTVPSTASCLFGVFAGEWMQEIDGDRIRKLLKSALILVIAGYFWNIWLPINKHLWTSSYVLLSAGAAMASLALCYWAIDVHGWRKWAQPFVWYGVNPLALYFAAVLLSRTMNQFPIHGTSLKELVFRGFYLHLSASPYLASMLYGLTYVLLFCVIAWALFRKNVFIRV